MANKMAVPNNGSNQHKARGSTGHDTHKEEGNNNNNNNYNGEYKKVFIASLRRRYGTSDFFFFFFLAVVSTPRVLLHNRTWPASSCPPCDSTNYANSNRVRVCVTSLQYA